MDRIDDVVVDRSNLFHKDFLLVVIGQIISLFGSNILRFALPLYILDITGSQVIFGSILAISMIPTIILSPMGGILSDRLNKRNIMVILDFITAIIVGTFTITLTAFSYIWVVALVLILLSVIQGFYQPAVQSSVPLISSNENLLQSNAVVNLVTSLATLLGPVIGGILYGYWGLISITTISAICFFLSAIMEIYIFIPHIKQKVDSNLFNIVRLDLKESIDFVLKENPIIIKVTLLIALFNMFLSPMIVVGIPILIKMTLNMSNQLYGFSQASLGVGGIIGGIIAGTLTKRLNIKNYYSLVLFASITIIPIGLSVFLPLQSMLAYLIVTISCFAFMVFSTIFSVSMIVFIQRETPGHLLGKVMSLVMTGTMCAQPVGQAIYGLMFKLFENNTYIIFFATFIVGVLLALWLKKIVKNIVSIHYA